MRFFGDTALRRMALFLKDGRFHAIRTRDKNFDSEVFKVCDPNTGTNNVRRKLAEAKREQRI